MYRYNHLARGAFSGPSVSCYREQSIFSELSFSFTHIKSAIYEDLLGVQASCSSRYEKRPEFSPRSECPFLKNGML